MADSSPRIRCVLWDGREAIARNNVFCERLFQGSSMQNILLKRLHSHGILEATDMTGSHQGEVHSNPWYSSINALAAAQFDRPYDLGLNANASRIIVENKKVAGVEVISLDRKTHTIRAKNVVVSASTLETPQILLSSGIEGPAIGRYLTGHVSIIAIGTISGRQFSDKLGNLSILKFETKEDPDQIQILGPDQFFSY